MNPKKATYNPLEVSKCVDNLMKGDSNRYQITMKVANRAERRREEEVESDQRLPKPVIRAILEMCDKLTQPDIVGESELGTAQRPQKLTEFPRDLSEHDFDDLSQYFSFKS